MANPEFGTPSVSVTARTLHVLVIESEHGTKVVGVYDTADAAAIAKDQVHAVAEVAAGESGDFYVYVTEAPYTQSKPPTLTYPPGVRGPFDASPKTWVINSPATVVEDEVVSSV